MWWWTAGVIWLHIAAAEAGFHIEFRSDTLVVPATGGQVRAAGAVVVHLDVRGGRRILCCTAVTAELGPDGSWRRLVCRGDVRLGHDDVVAWSEVGELDVPASRLVLRGRARLRGRQGEATADQIAVGPGAGDVEMLKPRGSWRPGPPVAAVMPTPPWARPAAPLPTTCPLPARPPG